MLLAMARPKEHGEHIAAALLEAAEQTRRGRGTRRPHRPADRHGRRHDHPSGLQRLRLQGRARRRARRTGLRPVAGAPRGAPGHSRPGGGCRVRGRRLGLPPLRHRASVAVQDRRPARPARHPGSSRASGHRPSVPSPSSRRWSGASRQPGASATGRPAMPRGASIRCARGWLRWSSAARSLSGTRCGSGGTR